MHDFFSDFAAQQEKAISITKTADPHPKRTSDGQRHQ